MLAARYDAARTDFERVLKQRNALLRGGVRDDDARTTLDVFDDQLVQRGGRARARPPAARRPAGAGGRRRLRGAGDGTRTASWPRTTRRSGRPAPLDGRRRRRRSRRSCAPRSMRRRRAEIERGVTLVGPHRDDCAARRSTGSTRARRRRRASSARSRSRCGSRAIGVVTELTGTRAGAAARRRVQRARRAPRRPRSCATSRRVRRLLTTAGVLPAGVDPEHRLLVDDGGVTEETGA